MAFSKLNATLLCISISVATLWAGTDLTLRYIAPMMQRQIQTAAVEVYGWAGDSWWHNRTPDPGDLSWQARLYVWVYGVPKGKPCPHPC
jgi:hypothetical protein